jgi:hypothetical protein
MLPTRTNLAKMQSIVPIAAVLEIKIIPCSSEKGSVVVDCKPESPKDPQDANPVEAVRQSNTELSITNNIQHQEFTKAVEQTEKALNLAEQGAVRKSNNKKLNHNSNTEQFLEELHKLVESWSPQSLDWEGDRRPILYDFECRDEIRKLMINHGL